MHGGSGESEQSTVLSQAMGVIGGVIGAYFGGPQGAMAGYSAGTKVGSGVAKLGTNDGDAGMKDILGGGMEAVIAVIGSGGKKDAEVPGAQAAIQNRTGTRSINRASARIA